jgi:hypothetical protein
MEEEMVKSKRRAKWALHETESQTQDQKCKRQSWVMVPHSLKSAQANSSGDPISKKPSTKKGLVEWLKV